MTTAADDGLELLAMGCRWTLDVSALPDAEAEAMRRRWSRCAALVGEESAVVLDPTVEPVLVVPVDAPVPEGQSTDLVRVIWSDPETLPYDLSRAVTTRGINRTKGSALLLHAAALADPSGRALVLTAPSGSGKSTASRRLGERLGYITDESVVITWDDDGSAVLAPYPKPPSIIIDPEQRHLKEERSPDDLGLAATPPRPTLGALVVLERDDAHEVPELVAVPLVEHLLAIIPETSSLFELPGGLAALARAATAAGAPVALRYREIEGCHDLLTGLLAHGTAEPAPWWAHHPPAEHPTPSPTTTRVEAPTITDDTVVRRAPWSDAVEDDVSVLVLVGEHPFVLGGVGALAWLHLTEPADLRELTRAAVDAFGDHDDAPQLVRDALGAMVEAGIVVIDDPVDPTTAADGTQLTPADAAGRTHGRRP